MTYFIQGILNGSTYSLVAIGFVTIYSVVKAFQFAHGSVVMLSSYLFLGAYNQTHNVVLSLLFVLVAMAILGVLISRIAFEPLLGRHFPSLIAALGVSIVIQQLVAINFYQGQAVSYPSAIKIRGAHRFLGATVDNNKILVLVIAVVTILLLDRFFAKTRSGMQMRAIADSGSGAQVTGINLKRTIRIGFVIAGLTAAIAGILYGLLFSSINPDMGTSLTIKGLAATLLGGSTSFRGAILGAFVIGLSESLAIGYLSSGFSDAISYVVILAILLARPQGLFGRTEMVRA